MTHPQNIALGKAIRKSLQIGDKVLVVPKLTHGDSLLKKRQRTFPMYVRELHNKTTAGLSRKKSEGSIYGILYSIIHPL